MKYIKFARYSKIGRTKSFYPRITEQENIINTLSCYIRTEKSENMYCEIDGSKLRVYLSNKSEVDRDFFIEVKETVAEDGISYVYFSLKKDNLFGITWRILTLVSAIVPLIFIVIVKHIPRLEIGYMQIVYLAISVLSFIVFLTSLPRKKTGKKLLNVFNEALFCLYTEERHISKEFIKIENNYTKENIDFRG